MNQDAFFVKPSKSDWRRPRTVPVPDRHVATVCRHPRLFGLTQSHIEETYRRHGEVVALEGYARNEILLALLKPPSNFVRIRYCERRGTWRIQIFERMNTSVCVSILHFLKQIKSGKIRDAMKRSSYPHYNVEIHDTKDNSLFVGKTDEAIAYANEREKENMIVRKCHLLGARGKVEVLSSAELDADGG